LSILLEEKNEKKQYHKNEISKIEEQLKEYNKNISSIQESINLLKQKKE
jgi:prefoldin subunit 5